MFRGNNRLVVPQRIFDDEDVFLQFLATNVKNKKLFNLFHSKFFFQRKVIKAIFSSEGEDFPGRLTH